MSITIGGTRTVDNFLQSPERLVLYSGSESNLVRISSGSTKAYYNAGDYVFGKNANSFVVQQTFTGTSATSNLLACGVASNVSYRPFQATSSVVVGTTLQVSGNTTLAGTTSMVTGTASTAMRVENWSVAPASSPSSLANPSFAVINQNGMSAPVIAVYPTGQTVFRDRIGINTVGNANYAVDVAGSLQVSSNLRAGLSVQTNRLQSATNANTYIQLEGTDITFGGNITIAQAKVEGSLQMPGVIATDFARLWNVDVKNYLDIVTPEGCNMPSLSITNSNLVSPLCNVVQVIGSNDAALFCVTADGRVGVGTVAPLPTNAFTVQCSHIADGLVVDLAGNVGIGTYMPLHDVHIVRSAWDDHTLPTVGIYHDSPASSNSPFLVAFSNQASQVRLDANGALTLGKNAVYDPKYQLNVGGTGRMWQVHTDAIVATNPASNLDFGRAVLSNTAQLYTSNITASNMSIDYIRVGAMDAISFALPGFTVSTTQFWFGGQAMYLGDSFANIPTNPQTQGKVKIDVPGTTSGTSLGIHIAGQTQGNIATRVVANNATARYELHSATTANPLSDPTLGVLAMDATNRLILGYEVTSTNQLDKRLIIADDGIEFGRRFKVFTRSVTGFVGVDLPEGETPQASLEVNGSMLVRSRDAEGATVPLLQASYEDGDDFKIKAFQDMQCRSNLHVMGTVITQNVVSVSDSNLKTDLVPIGGALDKLATLRGYTYQRRGAALREAGLLAQDLVQVLPEAVRTIATDETASGSAMTIAYGNLAGLFVEAIKELRAEVRDLRQQVLAHRT